MAQPSVLCWRALDDSTLESLEAALAASPENTKLFLVVVHECAARSDLERLRAIFRACSPASFAAAGDRVEVARARLLLGEPAAALELLGESTGEELLVRARALVDLNRREEAAAAYARAIKLNPTLEDRAFKALIGARVHEGARGGPRLAVISNDDTDQTELNRLLVPNPDKVTFADVGGLHELKKEIERRIILPYRKPSIFQRFKKRVGGGILLYGPPGCGKTLIARATAGECAAQFFNVAIADVLDMYIGESERKLHAIFEKARSSAPAVIFFDELEALAAKRQYTREGTSSKLVSQFLSEMDGFAQNNAGVLILGATNVPWAVDSAFRRAGRFDRVLFVPPPDREARLAILRQLLAARPAAPNLELGPLAEKTRGFSGADLTNLVETAADEAIQASLDAGAEVPINRQHLSAALGMAKPTIQEWLTTARNYARYANESGHYDDVLAFLKRHGKP